jgi:hypothetical protein
MPGDIIIYLNPENDGDIEHSGIVIEKGSERTLGVPIVCSKWGSGREYVHLASHCPYTFAKPKYYRISL